MIHSQLDEAKKQAALDSAIMKKRAWAGLALALTVGTWFGYIPYSPLDLLQYVMTVVFQQEQISVEEISTFKSLEALPMFAFEFLRGIAWAFCIIWVVERRYQREIGIILAGSVEAYEDELRYERGQRRALEQQELDGHDLGMLLSISTQKGGFISTPTTLVETTIGYYRVEGYVDTALKGAPVKRVYGNLFIGSDGNSAKFRLVGS